MARAYGKFSDLITFTRASGGTALRPIGYGSELVTNGTFDTDSDWIKSASSDWAISGGVATSSGADGYLYQQNTNLQQGKVYALTYTITSYTSGVIRSGLGNGLEENSGPFRSSIGTFTDIIVRTFSNDPTDYFGLFSDAFVGSVDNITVREINPLSVSIQMDGKISYTKSGSNTFFRWLKDADTYMNDVFFSDYRFISAQKYGTTYDQVATDVYFSGDLLEPYSIASRHGSTFINGAVDGIALTANTTPTALPDLSSTDLALAYNYMGTIRTFRIWDKDLGDTGIAAATAPSLEPTLSLSFDETQASYINKNWSV